MNIQPIKYEVWTKNEVHYIMADGKAIAWDHDHTTITRLCARMTGKHLPMIPEFKTFLPVRWR